jgi:membrane fusion protein, type I secretion system
MLLERAVAGAPVAEPDFRSGGPASNNADVAAEVRRWNLVGALAIAVFFGGTLAWSSLAPLSSAVVAQGQVKVDSSRKKIQHLEGGIVKEILVRDGDEVSEGQVLVRLDETRADAAHGVIRDAYQSALAQQARLVAERDGETEVTFPVELLGVRNDETVAKIIATQDALFEARRASLVGRLDITDRQILSLRREVDGLGSQQRAKEQQIAILTAELEGLNRLLASGLVDRTQVRNVERELARLAGEAGEHVSEIASVQATIAEKEIEKYQIRQTFREDVMAELRQVQSESFDLAEREGATRHVLDQTEIKAPVAGTVVDVKVHTLGGVIGPGEVLMEVVPANDRLMVEARVSPQDIDRLLEGLDAGVKLAAFDSRRTPELNGKVVYVAADATVDERTGATYVVTRIEVPEHEVARLDGQNVQPGMLASVFVRTGERTFISYLFSPLVDSFNQAWRER